MAQLNHHWLIRTNSSGNCPRKAATLWYTTRNTRLHKQVTSNQLQFDTLQNFTFPSCADRCKTMRNEQQFLVKWHQEWNVPHSQTLLIKELIQLNMDKVPRISHISNETYHPNNTLDTLRPRQNGHLSPDGIFKCIFLNGNVCISIKIHWSFS